MKFLRKLRSLFRRQKLDAEMTQEMRTHIEFQTKQHIATGMNPDEARYLAQRKFGNVASIQERAREQRGLIWLEQGVQDLRYAARQLRKAPGFTTVAVITLALGIGVNATMFRFVQNMFLRPFIQQKRERLVALYTSEASPGATYRDFSFAEYSALRSSTDIFSGLGAMNFDYGAVGRGDAVKRSFLCFVSDNYFQLLGVQPLAGRFFTAEEARPNAGRPVVVANYALWQRLGAPADFVGSQIEINAHAFTVIGIAPAGFGGMHVSIGPDVWLPLGALPVAVVRSDDLLDPRTFQLSIFGALQPGLTLETARPRMDNLGALDALANSGGHRRLVLTATPLFSVGNSAPVDESNLASFAALSLGLSASVLVVACLNLANMLLARGTARRKEIALRLSLGATRGRVVRQLLVEAFLLAGIGSVLGLMMAEWTGVAMAEFARAAFAEGTFTLIAHTASLDLSLVLATAFFAVAATFVFGLAPALRVTRSDLVDDLKRQGGQSAAAGVWNRFFSGRHCLVMAQISLSLMLLFSAGLFVRGARKAGDRDPGFRLEGGLVFNIDYGFNGASGTPVSRKQEALLAQAVATPGVERAALASAVPYNFESDWRKFMTADASDGHRNRVSPGASASVTEVSRGYFQTLGIPLLRGRDFTAAENQPGHLPMVALIDDQLARALFGENDAVGRHIVAAGDDEDAIEIIGIVRSPYEDVWDRSAPRRVYRPLGQVRRPNTYLHVQLSSPTAESAVLGQLRRTLGAMDPDAPVLLAKPLANFVQKNINLVLPRLAAIAFGAFGVISLVLAVVGVYGVKAYAVASRTKEIGIRIALGARPRDVMALILRQGAVQTGIGVLMGTGLALGAGRALSKMLYQMSPADPASLGFATLLVALAALLACFVPARRATKVEPTVALRAE